MIRRLSVLTAGLVLVFGGIAMAQTQVVNLPQQNRSGTQTSPFAVLPNDGSLSTIRLQGVAAAATLTDTLNHIVFVIYISPDGQVGTRREVQRFLWTGGLTTDKNTGLTVPVPIDIEFGPLEAFAGQQVQLEASFQNANTGASRTINVGATLTANPSQ